MFEHIREFAEGLDCDVGFEQVKVEELLRVFEVSFLEEDLREVLENLPYVSTILSLGLFLLGVLKLRERGEGIEEIVKRLEKVEKVVIIVDDFADFEEGSREVILDFLELCYSAGIRVFVVQRMWKIREEAMSIVRAEGGREVLGVREPVQRRKSGGEA